MVHAAKNLLADRMVTGLIAVAGLWFAYAFGLKLVSDAPVAALILACTVPLFCSLILSSLAFGDSRVLSFWASLVVLGGYFAAASGVIEAYCGGPIPSLVFLMPFAILTGFKFAAIPIVMIAAIVALPPLLSKRISRVHPGAAVAAFILPPVLFGLSFGIASALGVHPNPNHCLVY